MRRSFLFWSLLALVLSLLTGCERRTHTVRYEVGGNAAQVALTYRNASGASEQRDDQPPWSIEFAAETGAYLAVTAFNKTNSGTVSCKLYVDGRLVQEASSEGGYKLARCSALAGLEPPTPTP